MAETAQYELIEKAFIGDHIRYEGERIEVPANLVPGPHMIPLNEAAKKAFKQAGIENGRVRDGIDELR
ncbi:MAG: hypothetical protein ACLQVJ_17095 [Syntrophobacteraceae bacterium]